MGGQLSEISIKVLPSNIAKQYTVANHYMKTFPVAAVSFGVFYQGRLCGVLSFGYSTQTANKVRKHVPNIKDDEFIEMQRMHLDDCLGQNAESYVLSRCIAMLREHGIKLIITHAGGCKNDCGIVYQSSAWLYFGKEPCNDFYLTDTGEYKNIVAPRRYGRVPAGLKDPQEIGEALFGPGRIVNSYRYVYLYPVQKGLRSFLQKTSQPYPKDSEHFRKNQEWVS